MDHKDTEDITVYFPENEIVIGIEHDISFLEFMRSSSRFPSFEVTKSVIERYHLQDIFSLEFIDHDAIASISWLPAGNGPFDIGKKTLAVIRLQITRREALFEFVVNVAQRLKSEQNQLASNLTLRFAIPNFYAAGNPHAPGGGGPGGPPITKTVVSLSQIEVKPDLIVSGSRSLDTEVDVFILDTVPKLNSEGKLLADPVPGSPYDQHPLVHDVKNGFQQMSVNPSFGFHSWNLQSSSFSNNVTLHYKTTTTSGGLDAPASPVDDDPLAVLHDALQQAIEISDHGFFIAGIIRTMAPCARIHMIEVLDKYGVGSIVTVACGLGQMASIRSQVSGQNSHAIVNCSFVFSNPPVWGDILKGTSHEKDEALIRGAVNAAMQVLFKGTGDPKNSQPDIDNKASYIIVAAAGNDSQGKPTPLQAYYPARNSSVLGVGALDKKGQRADYSNIADLPESEGIYAIGTVTSVLTTGFAEWNGTSFACAVISGTLATIYCRGSSDPNGDFLAMIDHSTTGTTSQPKHVLRLL